MAYAVTRAPRLVEGALDVRVTDVPFARATGTDIWSWFATEPEERSNFDRAMEGGQAERADKLTLAALEGTLALAVDAPDEIPVLRMLREPAEAVRTRAARLAELVGGEVEETVARAGGGSLPLTELPSFACAVEEDLAVNLRAGDPPVIAVVRDGRTLLDCRTLTDGEADEVAVAVEAARA